MYYGLINDCAERAVSDACDGAATAASGSAADTVTVSEMFATVSRMAISSPPVAEITTPLRSTRSKPGTATSTVYVPGNRPLARNRPVGSVIVERGSALAVLASLRFRTVAFATAFPSGSVTTPLSEALLSLVCAIAGMLTQRSRKKHVDRRRQHRATSHIDHLASRMNPNWFEIGRYREVVSMS